MTLYRRGHFDKAGIKPRSFDITSRRSQQNNKASQAREAKYLATTYRHLPAGGCGWRRPARGWRRWRRPGRASVPRSSRPPCRRRETVKSGHRIPEKWKRCISLWFGTNCSKCSHCDSNSAINPSPHNFYFGIRATSCCYKLPVERPELRSLQKGATLVWRKFFSRSRHKVVGKNLSGTTCEAKHGDNALFG